MNILKTFTPQQMLIAIVDQSTNELHRSLARRILIGLTSTVREKERNHGAFMDRVIRGKWDEAYFVGNDEQRLILLSLTSFVTRDGVTVVEGQPVFIIENKEVHTATFVYGYHNERFIVFANEVSAISHLMDTMEEENVVSYPLTEDDMIQS